MTSRYRGSNIFGSQQSFVTDRDGHLHYSNDGRKVWATVSECNHAQESHTSLFLAFFFPFAIFAGPRSVEILKFCYHGNMT